MARREGVTFTASTNYVCQLSPIEGMKGVHKPLPTQTVEGGRGEFPFRPLDLPSCFNSLDALSFYDDLLHLRNADHLEDCADR